MVCSECGLEEGSHRPGSRSCTSCGATLPYEIKVTDEDEFGGWILVREDVGGERVAGMNRIGFWQRSRDRREGAIARVHRPFERNQIEYGRGRSVRHAIAAALHQAGYK